MADKKLIFLAVNMLITVFSLVLQQCTLVIDCFKMCRGD